MLLVIISPIALAVKESDFTLLAVGTQGSDHGKNIYINQRALKRHSKFFFEGNDFESTLQLLKNELSSTKNISGTLSNWFDQPSVLTLGMDEVDSFNALYQVTKEPNAFLALSAEQYEDGVSVGEYIMLNSLGDLVDVMRRLDSKEGDV